MKIYKFLDSKYGLEAIRKRRLKISRFDDLNDPFELIPYNLKDRNERWALKAMKSQLGQNRGMLCFSASWRDPVLWAHYAERHYGICIEFEVPEHSEQFHKVDYVSKRLPFPKSPTQADMQALLFTKYESWKYEQEIRAFAALNDSEDGLYFREFDATLNPTSVIAGARCKLSQSMIMQALGSTASQVKVLKARPGFRKFEIV